MSRKSNLDAESATLGMTKIKSEIKYAIMCERWRVNFSVFPAWIGFSLRVGLSSFKRATRGYWL
jgi:hypothetical protein